MATVSVTMDNFEQLVEQHPALVLDFWAEWCGPCKTFGPFYEQMAEANPDICFGKVNVEEAQELAAAFQVKGVPTLIFFKNGEIVYEGSGLPRAEQFVSLLDAIR